MTMMIWVLGYLGTSTRSSTRPRSEASIQKDAMLINDIKRKLWHTRRFTGISQQAKQNVPCYVTIGRKKVPSFDGTKEHK